MQPAWALTSGSRMQNPSLGKWDIMVSVVNWMIMQEINPQKHKEKWDLLRSQDHLAVRETGYLEADPRVQNPFTGQVCRSSMVGIIL